MLTQGTHGLGKLWEGYGKACKSYGTSLRIWITAEYWCCSTFFIVATYHGAVLDQLSSLSWNIYKDGIVITQGTPGMEKLRESCGKATNHTWERDLAYMEELSVWKSYGKAMGILEISYFYTRFSIHRWKNAMRNPGVFFFLWETAAGIIPAMVPWARQ